MSKTRNRKTNVTFVPVLLPFPSLREIPFVWITLFLLNLNYLQCQSEVKDYLTESTTASLISTEPTGFDWNVTVSPSLKSKYTDRFINPLPINLQ